MNSKTAKKNKRKRKRKYYRQFLKSVCERCGFVALHPCQLDIHHKDVDRTNNVESNLETLCSNCHRLESVGLLGKD